MKVEKERKNIWFKIILIVLLTINISLITIIIYFLNVDIISPFPEQLDANYNISKEEFQNRNVFILKPKEQTDVNKFILYLHGGYYIGDINNVYWDFLKNIVDDTGYTIIVPDYPLTPKYDYKDVFDMITPLYKEIMNKTNTTDLILMGDSSGGGMALALAEQLGENGIEQPDKLILISPWLDVTMKNPKIEEVQINDKKLDKTSLILAGMAYANGEDVNNYLVSPINGSLNNLKNVTIFTGTHDILNPDVDILKQRAEEQGININVLETENASHNWIIEDENTNAKKDYHMLVKVINE